MRQKSLNNSELIQTAEQLYQYKLMQAQQVVSRSNFLKHSLIQKKAENSANRYQFEQTLELERSEEIMHLFSNKTDKSLPALDQSLCNFRKAALLHFISEREEVIIQIRREFVVGRKEQCPTIAEILDFILPKAYLEFNHCLSTNDKTLLYSKLYNSGQIATYLFKLSLLYPLETDRKVDLHVLKDMKAFYGQLIGVLSGAGLDEWNKSNQQEEQLKEELKSYSLEQFDFPQESDLEPLLEDFRIFLISQTMRVQIQQSANNKSQDKIFQTQLCQKLLSKYSEPSQKDQTRDILSEFDKLPSISESILNRIRGVFNPTKEKYLQKFVQSNLVIQPVSKIYSSFKIIAELIAESSNPNLANSQLIMSFAAVLDADLRQSLAMIKQGTNIEAEIILDRIISAGEIAKAKLISGN